MTAPRRPGRSGSAGRAVRLTARPQEVGRGLGQVVVVLLELLRDLLERQAVRRMDSGALPPEQVEELGRALIEVREAIRQVRDSLGVTAEQARAATSRARELVGEWPPTNGHDQPTGTCARSVSGHGPGRRSQAGNHERGRPATRVRGAAPPG